ncbi:PAS domain-containing protein [Hahella ganghwensis]|uniref:PAS domain-containing protein n=1 Tax=Hahella ganghwensis TaxID=286420 RepID=UPI000360FA85|nr:PAS domain-containing protein [Hahella ganghwensis]
MNALIDFRHLFRNADPFAILELVFSQCYDAVVITRADPENHEIVYANPCFCRMTGYELNELKGKQTSILKGPKTNPSVIERLKQNLRDHTPFKGSAVNYRKDKTEYHVEWNIHYITDTEGNPQYYISIQRDLTSLKSTLSRLKASNDQFKVFLKNLTEERPSAEKINELKEKASSQLVDDAGLFSGALRSASRKEHFDDTELFGFEDGEKGVLPSTEHKAAMSAWDYAEKVCLSDYELDNLSTIINDLSTSIALLGVTQNTSSAISSITADFQELANALFFVEEFVELSTVFSELSLQLTRHDVQNKELPEFMITVFETLVKELKNWFNSVFVEKTSENIHAEDASLLASAKQILEFVKLM